MLENPAILTVSDLTRDIKEVLESVFGLVRVEGEISNLRQPASGHVYFSLKDALSQIRCVFFRNASLRLKFALRDGMKVVCSGRVGVYERDGQYQLYVEDAAPRGQGALQLAFEQMKEKLAKEGLFDEAHKRPLPFLPRAIGVVTSPTGAVIRDILHVLDRRFSAVHVVVAPVRVQGEGSADEIVAAIEEFNRLDNVDVVILARGGGSLEDLWSFNEESVARAIYLSRIPVLSAIGHETDYTIADFTADRRAPTPSAAAEIVIPGRAELREKIAGFLRQISLALGDLIPQRLQRVDDLIEQLGQGVRQSLRTEEVRLDGLMNRLHSLSPLAILKRGYSITSLFDGGHVLHATSGLKHGDKVRTRLAKGEFVSQVVEIVN